MSSIALILNGRDLRVPEGRTILEAAKNRMSKR